MLFPHDSTRFKRDLKQAIKRGWNIEKIKYVIRLLLDDKPLPAKYRDHQLTGNYKDFRECHVEPNWLLIYQKDSENVYFTRTGTHSDLFD